MANTTIKITQLPSIGNGLSASTLLPVVNTSGTAVTEKVTVGAVANYVLTQAGNTLSPAFLSTIAYSVSNASQPNITSVGTLSVNTLKISGGIVGYYLQTDGSGNLTWAPGGGGNGAVGGINTQVQFNDAGNFSGNTGFTFNKTTGIFSSPFLAGNGNGLSNIQGANVSGFVPNANVANTAFSVAGANVSGFVPNANVANTAFAVAAANVSGLGNIATINLTGSTTNVLYGNGVFAAVAGGANTGNVTFNGNVISTSGTNDLLINLNNQDFIANTSNGGAIGLYSGNSQIAINNDTPGIEITSLNVNLVALANGDINLDATAANGVIDIESAGNTTITTNGNVWTFDTTGNVTIPGSIIGTNTIEIDNRATGNNADINLYSADDILLQARDRATGSTAEGGDINIFAGDSAEDSDTSGGDVIIEAGRGGASNIDYGGTGGFVSVSAGRGGNAVGANFSARSGGSLTLNAGDAGANNGNIDLGNTGGDVTINAGDTTSNGDSGGSIILRSGDAGANALAGQVQIIIPSSDEGNGGTWTFDGEGIIQLPNSGTISNDGNNIDIGSSNAISLEASSAVNIYTDTGTNAYQWQFQDDGNLRLPTIQLDVGNTINEQTVIQSQRKIIPGLRYSAEINGTTPTVVYTATSIDTTSMKVAMQIQHTGLGFEFFDVSATSTGGDTFYTVSNRVQPPTIDNSTVVVDLNGSNVMEITVTINSGAANSWVTYDATEFGIAVD
jgi:hypothetical protein